MTIQELYQLFLSLPKVCTDSRKATEGGIFFALKGANFNGNKFAEQALADGCSYAVIDEAAYSKGEQYIVVEDVLVCLQALANHHRKQLNCPVIGITGTNGKTTTKELMYAVLNSKYKTVATQGNLNNHIGVPLTLLSTPTDTEMLIVEMGANHQGEIAFLSGIAEPNYGIITNIGKAHLEGFGGYEGVIQTKSELYRFIQKTNGKLFVNQDDDLLLSLSENIEQITYGADTSLAKVDPLVSIIFKNVLIGTKLIGAYNYPNLAAACSIGSFFGVSVESCKEAIENYTPSNNRSQIEQSAKGNTLILDAYNANPSSMELAIQSFEKMEASKKIAILGDMLELGEDSYEEHQAIVNQLKKAQFEDVFLVGKEFKQTESNFSYFDNSKELSNWIVQHPLKDSTVLLKGSRGIRLESLREVL
jgi:UDP-N-acetylmuramoyl-tripeptide--D-alanyl-D-alanine ligase